MLQFLKQNVLFQTSYYIISCRNIGILLNNIEKITRPTFYYRGIGPIKFIILNKLNYFNILILAFRVNKNILLKTSKDILYKTIFLEIVK